MATGAESFRKLLSSVPVLSLEPKSGAPASVVCVPAEASIETVLQTLATNHILSAPVFPRGGTCLGLLDILDILVVLMERVEESDRAKYTNIHHRDDRVYDVVIEREPEYWLDMAGKLALKVTHAQEILDRSQRNPYLPVYAKDNPTLLDALAVFARGVHRLPVVGPDGRIVRILSQSSVVSFLAEHLDALGEWASQSVADSGLGQQKVVSVAGHVAVVDAFKLMHSRGVSCLGVVDADGLLAGVLSPSDLKYLSAEAIHGKLQLSVAEFLADVRGREGRKSGWIVTVTREATIADVVRLLHEQHIHRLFVVDPVSHKGLGVVSLTDILALLARSS